MAVLGHRSFGPPIVTAGVAPIWDINTSRCQKKIKQIFSIVLMPIMFSDFQILLYLVQQSDDYLLVFS